MFAFLEAGWSQLNERNDEEDMLVAAVRAFIDRDVKPTVREVEHADTYPEAWPTWQPNSPPPVSSPAMPCESTTATASCEYDVERYFRDAPLMIVGAGTNEIQRNVIAGQLVTRGGS